MTRRTQIAVVAVFLATITVPLLLFVVGVRPAMSDNRARTPRPDFTPGNALELAYFEQLTAYLTDRLPLRDRAIRADAELEDAVTLTDPISSDAPRGSDGWLFLPSTLADDCLGPPPDEFFDHADALAAAAEEADLPLVFLVPPDKESIHPEHLPVEGLAGVLDLDRPAEPECGRLWREQLAAGAEDRGWLLPLAATVDAASNDPDDPVFWRTDTHWTDRGALFGVEAVVEALRPGTWDPAEIVPGEPDTRTATDLSVMRGLPAPETAPSRVVERPGVSIDKRVVGPGLSDLTHTVEITDARSVGAPLVPGTTVVVGDSFGRVSLHLLQPYFEQLVFVPWQMVAADGLAPVLDAAGVPPGEVDSLVVLQVQRNLAEGNYLEFIEQVEQFATSSG